MRNIPPPDLVIYLDAAPAACLERAGKGSVLSLDDHERLGDGVREVAREHADKGVEVYKRRWTSFGSTNAIRDTVLCHPPKVTSGLKARAPPSAAAVECILQVRPPTRPRAPRCLPSAFHAASPRPPPDISYVCSPLVAICLVVVVPLRMRGPPPSARRRRRG